jgi:predicted anti-sigma-YlaC factor YlaD
MTHPDADTLLKFALKTLDESESSSVAEHLSVCEKCRDLQQKILGELARLEEVEIHIDVPAPPGIPRRRRMALAVLRWAAVLATGFLLGYMTAQLSDPVRPVVVQQRLIPTRAEVSSSGYVSCQAIDVTTSP